MSPSGAPDYERTDVAPRLLAWLACGLLLFLALAPVLLGVIYPMSLAPRALADPFSVFPTPRLQVMPVRDFAAFRKAEEARLASFGWNDAGRHGLRIPIDRAMTLIEERGLPAWPKP